MYCFVDLLLTLTFDLATPKRNDASPPTKSQDRLPQIVVARQLNSKQSFLLFSNSTLNPVHRSHWYPCCFPGRVEGPSCLVTTDGVEDAREPDECLSTLAPQQLFKCLINYSSETPSIINFGESFSCGIYRNRNWFVLVAPDQEVDRSLSVALDRFCW